MTMPGMRQAGRDGNGHGLSSLPDFMDGCNFTAAGSVGALLEGSNPAPGRITRDLTGWSGVPQAK